MAKREPRRIEPGKGYRGEGGHYAGFTDGPPQENRGLFQGGRAVPSRSEQGRIGPAGGDTRPWLVESEAPPTREGAAPHINDELRSGPGVGTRGNSERPKTAQEYGDSVRESRGVRTRPVRPGQHA
jgi:hypothetical protein